jgi:hypothetical protein
MVNETGELQAQARTAWIKAKHDAYIAQVAAIFAEETACQRFAEYAEVEQPGFAHYFRRVLKRQHP